MIAKLITVKRKLVVSFFTLVFPTGAFVFNCAGGNEVVVPVLPARKGKDKNNE
jgi:hypothetical protein